MGTTGLLLECNESAMAQWEFSGRSSGLKRAVRKESMVGSERVGSGRSFQSTTVLGVEVVAVHSTSLNRVKHISGGVSSHQKCSKCRQHFLQWAAL